MNAAYTIELKNTKKALLQRVVWIWYVILILFIPFLLFKFYPGEMFKKLVWKEAFLFLIGLLYFFYKKSKQAKESFNLLLFYLSCLAIYNILGIYFALLFGAFCLFVRWFVAQPTQVKFGAFIMIKNGLFKRKLEWSSLNNIIIKDDLLTIDFLNDHLIQEEVMDLTIENVEEINRFFAQKLNRI